MSSPPPPTPTICYRKRTSIAWLLLHHCFLTAYSTDPNNTDANFLSNISSARQPQTLPQQTSHNNPISNYISTISTCINRELLDFHLADEQLCDKISSLDLDTVDEATYHTPNPIEQLFISLSNELDNKIHGIEILDLLLTDAIANLGANKNDANTPDETPLGYEPQQDARPNNLTDKLGPSIPPTTPMHSPPTPSSLLFLHGGIDNDNPFDSPWSFTTPHLPLPPHDSQNKDSHGCTMSLLFDGNYPPDQTLQPHEPVCDSNTNNNNKKHTMTTIYTQNAQGLWRRPRDTDGNILVDAPPDLTKLEYIIDHMRAHDIGAWLLQETWEEGNNFDTKIGGYHVFCHNAERGVTGRQHLYRGVAIILSSPFYEV